MGRNAAPFTHACSLCLTFRRVRSAQWTSSMRVMLSMTLLLLACVHRAAAVSLHAATTSCTCECSAQRRTLPSLIRDVKGAVATIHVYNDMGDVVGQGSGWFITERVVVSTRHTFWKEDMKSAAYSKVTTNSPTEPRQYLVKSVLADDIAFDLLLLEVVPVVPVDTIVDMHHQQALEVSVEDVEEGQDVFVISTPLGLPGVVSTGIVSAIHNEFDLQVSAAVSTGSSGAPIFNYDGKVIGVVSGHLTTGQNLNFGLSIRTLAAVIAKLRPTLHISSPLQLPSDHDVRNNKVLQAGPGDPDAQVTVWRDSGATEERSAGSEKRKEASFASKLDALKAGTARQWCYPTLSDWVIRQNAALQDKGERKWWKGWKTFIRGLWDSPNGTTTATVATPPKSSSVPTEETQSYSPSAAKTALGPSLQQGSNVSQESTAEVRFSVDDLLEDIAALRRCTQVSSSNFTQENRTPSRYSVEVDVNFDEDGNEGEVLDLDSSATHAKE